MASEWNEIGTVEFEDDLAIVVQQWGGFVRIAIVDHEGEMSVAMGAGTREQFQRLFMEAGRQAEAGGGELPGQKARAAIVDDFAADPHHDPGVAWAAGDDTAYGRGPREDVQ